MEKSVLFAPIIPACFAVAALCFPVSAYSVEQMVPIDAASSSSDVAINSDMTLVDGASSKEPGEITEVTGGAASGDVQSPVDKDEDSSSSPASEASTAPSSLPSNPQISDLPATDIEEGVYEISNGGSNRLLDVSGGSCDNGANVQQYAQNGTPAQRWRIEKFNGHYLLVNVASGKALDVSGGNGANGTNVQQYVLNHTNAQVWNLVKIAQAIDDGL